MFDKTGNTENEIRLTVTPSLPVGTACLPGAAEGANVAPLQWVEYAVVDPFDANEVGSDFFDFDGMFYIDLSDTSDIATQLRNADEDTFRESPNRVLVRRILDSVTGNVRPQTTQIIAEFVTNFEVSFLIDTNSGT
ncbi:MAG: hypothetical protein WBN38_01400, partial [Polyangiales bacterium]